MSRTDLDLSDERLGEALGRAMHQHVRSETAPPAPRSADLAAVRSGARRRQTTRRLALSTACVALIGVAGVAVVNRAGSTGPVQPASQPGTTIAPEIETAVLPAFAVLDISAGLTPEAVYADSGGNPNGAAMPAIDVWDSGDVTLVVRTWSSTAGSDDDATLTTDAATATTIAEDTTTTPWRDRSVEQITVRGSAGAIEQLADDQFEIWLPGPSSDGYTVVAARGLDRQAALAQVEQLTEAGGVLQPSAEFTRTEQVAGAPVSAPIAAYAQVAYGLADGPWVVSWLPAAGATSLEGTLASLEGGRRAQVAGRDVLVSTDDGRVSVQWLDASGVAVSIGLVGTEEEALALVDAVRTIDQSAFVALASDISRWVEQELPVAETTDLGGLQIERRNDSSRIALCIGSTDSAPLCTATSDVNGGVIDVSIIIDGRWYAVGYRPPTDDDYTPDMTELTFTTSDAARAPVAWRATDDGGTWYVADLGDARTVNTNLGMILGGIVGTISRPIVPSIFG